MSFLSFLIAAAAGWLQQPAEQVLRFAPFAVEVNVAFQPDHETSDCAVTLHGGPDQHWINNACRNVTEPHFLEALGVPEDGSGRLTVILALEAGGRSVAPAPAGRMTFRSRAQFSLAPSGAIARCAPGEATGLGGILNLCTSGLPQDRSFVPGAEGREGTLSFSAFIRTASAPASPN